MGRADRPQSRTPTLGCDRDVAKACFKINSEKLVIEMKFEVYPFKAWLNARIRPEFFTKERGVRRECQPDRVSIPRVRRCEIAPGSVPPG
jgi:hypothetical protein